MDSRGFSEILMNNTPCDVLILGSGLAGLTTALHLADRARVAIVAKREVDEGASFYAQGGIAAVLDAQDSVTFTFAIP